MGTWTDPTKSTLAVTCPGDPYGSCSVSLVGLLLELFVTAIQNNDVTRNDLDDTHDTFQISVSPAGSAYIVSQPVNNQGSGGVYLGFVTILEPGTFVIGVTMSADSTGYAGALPYPIGDLYTIQAVCPAGNVGDFCNAACPCGTGNSCDNSISQCIVDLCYGVDLRCSQCPSPGQCDPRVGCSGLADGTTCTAGTAPGICEGGDCYEVCPLNGNSPNFKCTQDCSAVYCPGSTNPCTRRGSSNNWHCPCPGATLYCVPTAGGGDLESEASLSAAQGNQIATSVAPTVVGATIAGAVVIALVVAAVVIRNRRKTSKAAEVVLQGPESADLAVLDVLDVAPRA